MRWRKRAWVYGLWSSLIVAGCADETTTKDADGFPNGGADEGSFDGGAGGGSNTGGSNGSAAVDAGLPPEQEEGLSFEAPSAGKSSVYVPNPVTHRVAVVNASTFAIETVASGRAPTYSATVPGEDLAVVLNVGSSDASILRTVDGNTSVKRVPVGHPANAIAIAPNAAHAVLFFNVQGGDKLTSTFQDVTVLSLAEGKEGARGVSVGFRPRAVQFSADGKSAFVITEDGISVIDLEATDTGPMIAPLVSVGDKLKDKLSSDIQVTPSGSHALARREGEASLRLVQLSDGKITTLDLAQLQAVKADDGGTPDAGTLPSGDLEITDVDVAPDGTFALAVLRNVSTLLRIPIPGGFSDPASIEARTVDDQLIGSVSISKNGKVAVAYTTASPVEGVVLIDLAANGPTRGVRLRKSVRAVALSDDGTRAFVLHSPTSGNAESPEEAAIDQSEGYSLVDTKSGFAKLELTPARVRERDLCVTRDTSRLFALLRDDRTSLRALTMADLQSFQVVTFELPKPPSSIGLVPGVERVFVGHESQGGMITFFDDKTGDVVKAVSGFELASRIRQ